MSWFVQGNDAKRSEFIQNSFKQRALNFWMKQGETKEIVFLDDARFGCKEHKLKMGENRFKAFTCGRDAGMVCEFCNEEKNTAYSEYYSILDLTPYTDKANKVHKYSRKLLCAGKDVASILELRRKEQLGNLLGARFKVTRTGEKSPACGNDWTFVAKIPPEKFPPDTKPYDYLDLLKPISQAEARSILDRFNGLGAAATSFSRNDIAPAGSDPFGASAPPAPGSPASPIMADDEVPF